MKLSFALLAFTTLAVSVSAQVQTPIAATGYNQDVIANGTAAGTTNAQYATQAQATTTTTIDGLFNLFAAGFVSPASIYGLPNADDRAFASFASPGTTFQLQDYSSNNVLLLGAEGGTGSLTLATARAYTDLSFLVSGYNGNDPGTYTLNFVGGTSTAGTFTAADNFNVNDNVAISGFGRVNRTSGALQADHVNPRMYEVKLALTATDALKSLQSVTFTNNAVGGTTGTSLKNIGIYGISGAANPVPEPASLVALGLGAAAFLRRRRAR